MSATWSGLLRTIGVLLAGFYAVVPNYGVSIVLLTVVVNALLFPLTLKQTRSMRAMQMIQPQVKALREEWKHDRERLNQETMALYKEAGVNPAAGCLPMLLQFPVWIALFRVLRNSVGAVPVSSALHGALEAGRTGFLGVDLLVSPSVAWSGGLIGALPYLVLVLALVVTGYAQQRQTAARMGATPRQQQQTMQRVMRYLPLLFGFVSWRMPAGLVLYWTTSQSLRTGQQALVSRLDRSRALADPGSTGGAHSDVAASTAAPPGSETGGEGADQVRPPRPHPRSKKKRNRRRRRR